MKILGIDSSGLVASVAILLDDQLLGEYTINNKKTHSQTLLPMLSQLKGMLDLDLSTIDAIAVAGGPGSFTGLRIGSATAKGIGMALNVPLIHVPTVDGLAYNLYGYQHVICPLMDARRNQTYTGLYRFNRGELQIIKEQYATSITEIIQEINLLGEPVIFLGDGVNVFLEQINEQLTVAFSIAPAHMNRQRASSIALLGQTYYKEGKTELAKDHIPDYLRLSQAERERNEMLKQQENHENH